MSADESSDGVAAPQGLCSAEAVAALTRLGPNQLNPRPQAMLGQLLARMSKSLIAKAILKGVNAGVVAMLISIVITMGKNALVDVWTVLLLAGGLAGMFLLKLEPYWLVLVGIVIGIATALL